MSPITGIYAYTGRKLQAVTRCIYPDMSEAEMTAYLDPKNVATITIEETTNGVVIKAAHTVTTQLDGTYAYEYGVANEFPGYPGKTVMTKSGATLTEVWTTADNAVNTYEMAFSAAGVFCKASSSKDGLVGSWFSERINADPRGFFILESEENAAELMMQGGKVSRELANEILSYAARRVTEKDGVWTMTDYLGTGTEKTVSFRFGEEFTWCDKELDVDATHLIVMPTPNTMIYTMKDKSGRVDVWEGEVSREGFTWRVAKDDFVCTMFYRRVGDIMGSWRKVVQTGTEPYLEALGIPASLHQDIISEELVSSYEHLGKGLWRSSNNSKILPMEPLTLRMGEEVTTDVPNLGKVSALCTFTRTGMVMATTIAGKSMMQRVRIVGNTTLWEIEMLDVPCVKCETVMIRV